MIAMPQGTQTAPARAGGPARPPELQGFDLDALHDAILQALANERLDEQEAARIRDLPAVVPSLHAQMNPDLVVNDDGQVLLVIEKPMPDTIWWVEYDPDYKQLIFVTVAGQIMPFGVPIHPVVDAFLRFARTMFLIQIDDQGKIIKADERRVVVRKDGRV